jgi:hypothetical protein
MEQILPINRSTNGFGDYGTDAARTPKPGEHSDGMNEKHDEMAHRHPRLLYRLGGESAFLTKQTVEAPRR